MTGLALFIIGAVCCPLVLADIVLVENDHDNSDFALTWLRDYGYLRPTGDLTVESVAAAVLRMQNFMNVTQTGKVDEETLRVMKMPRCGVPDFEPDEDHTMSKRFRLREPWPAANRQLTYRIENYSSDMSTSDIRSDFATAFKQWEDNCGLTFTRVRGDAIIMMKFTPNVNHGDNPFKSTTIAHAGFPSTRAGGGDVHFNDARTFKKAGSASKGNYDLQYVTLHELGHSIGVAHSDKTGVIMSPAYNQAFRNRATLKADDIAAAQSLYGQ